MHRWSSNHEFTDLLADCANLSPRQAAERLTSAGFQISERSVRRLRSMLQSQAHQTDEVTWLE
jgi:hypothetical protein